MKKFLSQDNNPDSFTFKRDDTGGFLLEQDIQAYKEYCKQAREMTSKQVGGVEYKPLFLMPDIVAVKIMMDHGIDIHAADFMHDTEKKRKVRQIVKSEYPDLLLSNNVV